jgi:transcriptional regulator with XRE-family HTH domain
VPKPQEWPLEPKTLGEHLRKRRGELGLFQAEVVAQLGVKVDTYLLWEQDRHEPVVRYYPAIFEFLEYDPFPEPVTLPERIISQRRKLGLTISQAAKRTGVDGGTFRRWESGEWKPRMSGKAVRHFLAL